MRSFFRDKFDDAKRRHRDLTIDFEKLGTISIDEFKQAVFEDIEALKDIYGVKFVTAASLRLPITNEYGDPLLVKRPQGGVISRMDTHHYHPACLDYKL
jgi:hypothetical protein